VPPDRSNGGGRLSFVEDIGQAEPDSDVWAVKVDRIVSLTPLSLDLTSRVDFDTIAFSLGIERAVSVGVPELVSFPLACRWGFAGARRPLTLLVPSEESALLEMTN
jgi:hypothetical protein